MSDGFEGTRVPRRTLAGATILQIVPALYEEPNARAAVNVAFALLQAGARALVAAEDGPLVGELRAFGGEWIEFPNATANPLRLRKNARFAVRRRPALAMMSLRRLSIVRLQCIVAPQFSRYPPSTVTTLPVM